MVKKLNKAGFRVEFVDGAGAKKLARQDHETSKEIMKAVGIKKK